MAVRPQIRPNTYSKNQASTAAEKEARNIAVKMASQQPNDRQLEREEMVQAAKDIADLDAVLSGNFDTITRGSDSYSERAQDIRAAERLDTFLRTDPADFKGKFTERQEQIREQEKILNRLAKYGYSLDDRFGEALSLIHISEPTRPY